MREGDKPERCAVLISGYAFRHKVTGDGSRQIVSLHIPGEALDFQNLFMPESDHNVQMLSRGDVAEVPTHAIEELVLARPKVGEAVMIHTLVEASIFREWTLNIGRRDARSRIAHLPLRIRVPAVGAEAGQRYRVRTADDAGAAGRRDRPDPGARQSRAEGASGGRAHQPGPKGHSLSGLRQASRRR
jgi:CRP-like cAMP-binding protein